MDCTDFTDQRNRTHAGAATFTSPCRAALAVRYSWRCCAAPWRPEGRRYEDPVRGSRGAAVEHVADGGDELVDLHLAAGVSIERRADAGRLIAERDIDAADHLIDYDRAVAVAVAGAARGRRRTGA